MLSIVWPPQLACGMESRRRRVCHQGEALYHLRRQAQHHHAKGVYIISPTGLYIIKAQALYLITPSGVYPSLSVTALAVPPLPVGEAFCYPPFLRSFIV